MLFCVSYNKREQGILEKYDKSLDKIAVFVSGSSLSYEKMHQ